MAEVMAFPKTKEMEDWMNQVNSMLLAHQKALEEMAVAMMHMSNFMKAQDALNKLTTQQLKDMSL